MHTRIVYLLVTIIFISGIAHAKTRSEADEVVRETQVSYFATHSDGTKENVIVKYEAKLYHKVWQTGSSSKPLTGKIQDNRKCHYKTNARVYRQAFIVTKGGAQASVDDYQEVYSLPSYVDRGPDNFIEALTRHVTCGSVQLFAPQIAQIKASLINNFELLVAQDSDTARNSLRAMLKAQSLDPK